MMMTTMRMIRMIKFPVRLFFQRWRLWPLQHSSSKMRNITTPHTSFYNMAQEVIWSQNTFSLWELNVFHRTSMHFKHCTIRARITSYILEHFFVNLISMVMEDLFGLVAPKCHCSFPSFSMPCTCNPFTKLRANHSRVKSLQDFVVKTEALRKRFMFCFGQILGNGHQILGY